MLQLHLSRIAVQYPGVGIGGLDDAAGGVGVLGRLEGNAVAHAAHVHHHPPAGGCAEDSCEVLAVEEAEGGCVCSGGLEEVLEGGDLGVDLGVAAVEGGGAGVEVGGLLLEVVAGEAADPLHLVLAQLLDVADALEDVGDVVDAALLDGQPHRRLVDLDHLPLRVLDQLHEPLSQRPQSVVRARHRRRPRPARGPRPRPARGQPVRAGRVGVEEERLLGHYCGRGEGGEFAEVATYKKEGRSGGSLGLAQLPQQLLQDRLDVGVLVHAAHLHHRLRVQLHDLRRLPRQARAQARRQRRPHQHHQREAALLHLRPVQRAVRLVEEQHVRPQRLPALWAFRHPPRQYVCAEGGVGGEVEVVAADELDVSVYGEVVVGVGLRGEVQVVDVLRHQRYLLPAHRQRTRQPVQQHVQPARLAPHRQLVDLLHPRPDRLRVLPEKRRSDELLRTVALPLPLEQLRVQPALTAEGGDA